ncbi:calcium-binding protein P-like isoform X4 [Ruditapes philippinarum]|uniref:calcium-binding protein P-like isoform X4 n=1 Tax=Ruditapes philippinarum TaxID=129788 RepID=UPI00295B90A8|nr:calcium-binding protein P-like isoform X4 [Ruditapes philippinarum]
MADPNNPQAPPPAGPPPSYDEVQAMSGGQPGYPPGAPGPYPPYPAQDGFKYDGAPPYPTQPGYPGYPAQSSQVPYPTQPGVPYPYGAPASGMYGQAPPGTAAYNPQGGVTILNRNPDTDRMLAIQRKRKIVMFIVSLIFVFIFIYFVSNMLF